MDPREGSIFGSMALSGYELKASPGLPFAVAFAAVVAAVAALATPLVATETAPPAAQPPAPPSSARRLNLDVC